MLTLPDVVLALAALAHPVPLDTAVVRPLPRAQTTPAPDYGDAVDDPAIWIHPTHPESSLVLGTDKRGGLITYRLDGEERQTVSDGARPVNVDVIYDFPLGGKRVDLALAGCRPRRVTRGVKVWTIDPTGTLSDVTAGGLIMVLGGSDPYGTCVYHSARTGKQYFFVTNQAGKVEQYELVATEAGKITGMLVRAFAVSSMSEGCVADDELGAFYLSEEAVGIWKFGAEPDSAAEGHLVAKAGEHGLTPDVEGLTLYCGTGGKGYLIASSQGSDRFLVYERDGDNRYVLTIDPAAGQLGDVQHTDGIAVTSCPTSREFPSGLFVAQDGNGEGANQNFKLYAWEDIAGTRLIVDTGWSPREKPMPADPSTPVVGTEPAGDGRGERESGMAPPAGADGESGGDQSTGWVESPPLESETAEVAAPGAVKVEAGFEREHELDRREYEALLAFECVVNRRIQLRLEPTLYSEVRQPNGTRATGLGDVELSATVLALPETDAIPGVAFAAEVKLPSAKSRHIGSGKADYTGDFILSKRIGSFRTHLNVGYTVVGRPASIDVRNVVLYSLAVERTFGRFDVVGELLGHTRAMPDGAEETWLGSGTVAPELAGEELAVTLGGRYHIGHRLVASLGLRYEHDHAFEVIPGLGMRVR